MPYMLLGEVEYNQHVTTAAIIILHGVQPVQITNSNEPHHNCQTYAEPMNEQGQICNFWSVDTSRAQQVLALASQDGSCPRLGEGLVRGG